MLAGVIYQATGALSASRSAFVITVTHGAAIVNGYWFIVNGNTNLTIEPVTGTARRDLIIARVYDTEASDPASEGKLEIVKGTTTNDPTVPAGALILHQVDVPASGTGLVLTDRRIFTAATGAVKPVFGISNLILADQTPGTPLYDINTDIHWTRFRSDASNFHRMGAVQVAAGTRSSNQNVETGGPSLGVWQIYQAGPISLPSQANVVLVTGTWTMTALADAKFDLKLAFDNVEMYWQVLDSHGASNSSGDGDRTYTVTTTITNRAAGSHDLCWIAIMCGAGGPLHVHNMTYSWVALG